MIKEWENRGRKKKKTEGTIMEQVKKDGEGGEKAPPNDDRWDFCANVRPIDMIWDTFR